MEISKAKIKLYASLSRRKERVNQELFVAEGAKCVFETLPFFQLEALITEKNFAKNPEVSETLRRIPEQKQYIVSNREMEQISSLSTAPNLIAVYLLPHIKLPEPEELADELILALDGVQDPGNLGTIMRAADWFGVKHIIASRQTADIFNPKAVQATMGAIGRVQIAYTDLTEYIRRYAKTTGLSVYGTLLNGKDIFQSDLSPTGMIVMGNEGKGLTEQIRQLIDAPLLIPSYPADSATVESLNVAMATSITLAEFRRRQL